VSKRDRLRLTPDLTTRDLWRSRRWTKERGKMINVVYSSLWDFKSSFTCRKILRHGTFPLYFPSERKVCSRFLSPLKIHRHGWVFEPATFGSSGQHTNHYTTKATIFINYTNKIKYLIVDKTCFSSYKVIQHSQPSI
jgi:hypothetical protein